MLTKVMIENDQLIVIPQGIYKVASLTNKIEIPIENVVGATVDPGMLNEPKGIRILGTGMPGYWAGKFKRSGKETFYNISRKQKPVVIQLKNEKYTRLILGVDNPEETVDLINNSTK